MNSTLLSPKLTKTGMPSLNLLVVEPDHERRGEISSMLSGLGIEADSVSDEGHASQMLEKKNYHAILADGLLPGFHFLQLIAAKFTMNRSTPMPVVAAVLAEGHEVRRRWGAGNDFDERLEWPITPEKLRQFVTNCELHHQAF